MENIDTNLPIEMYSGGDRSAWRKKHCGLWQPIPKYRELSTPEIMATASHYYAYSTILKEWCLILEDDAILDDQFEAKITEIISTVDSSIDIIFLGGGFYINQVTEPYESKDGLAICRPPNTNTTVAYIIRKRASLRLLFHFKEFDLPIDFELAYQLKELNLKVAHVTPYIVQEGSKSHYESSIDNWRTI
jgi:GR25 family glycosyltransferase involved in LPS biosynthesis